MLNATVRNSPAPLDSGVGQETTVPSQVMSPSREGSLAKADIQPSSGSISQGASRVKDEPQSRVEHDSVEETKPDSSVSTLEVKSEQKESERKEESTTSVKQEERTPEPDSEDSITAERVAEELHKLSDTREPRVSAHAPPNAEEEANSTQTTPRERAFAPECSRERGYGPYVSQGARRMRGRYHSPDPFLFSDTIFLEHDSVSCLRDPT